MLITTDADIDTKKENEFTDTDTNKKKRNSLIPMLIPI